MGLFGKYKFIIYFDWKNVSFLQFVSVYGWPRKTKTDHKWKQLMMNNNYHSTTSWDKPFGCIILPCTTYLLFMGHITSWRENTTVRPLFHRKCFERIWNLCHWTQWLVGRSGGLVTWWNNRYGAWAIHQRNPPFHSFNASSFNNSCSINLMNPSLTFVYKENLVDI